VRGLLGRPLDGAQRGRGAPLKPRKMAEIRAFLPGFAPDRRLASPPGRPAGAPVTSAHDQTHRRADFPVRGGENRPNGHRVGAGARAGRLV
jgi:hypothetical protein